MCWYLYVVHPCHTWSVHYFPTMFVCLHSLNLGSLLSGPCAAQVILWRFRSNRTDHLKVLNIVKKTKSGSGAAPKLTAKQLFKLNRYAFLDAYQRSRSTSSTLGQVNTQTHPSFSLLYPHICNSCSHFLLMSY